MPTADFPARREIRVTYRIYDTTAKAVYTADDSCITMTPHATVIDLTGGLDEHGRGVRGALYREAWEVVIYQDPDGPAAQGGDR